MPLVVFADYVVDFGPLSCNTHVLVFCPLSPGAGKSTIAKKSLRLLRERRRPRNSNDDDRSSPDAGVIGLDLDVCVPQWMRENFAKGIYPSFCQRTEFISAACDHVQSELVRATVAATTSAASSSSNSTVSSVVSFSFVNVDLRTAFRARFPAAVWMLVDTDFDEAKLRIEARKGHFYKGEEAAVTVDADAMADVTEVASANEGVNAEDNRENTDGDDDNSEWEFRPVDFPHIVLDGCADVETNANRVVVELCRAQCC